jgi:hypothetical protein
MPIQFLLAYVNHPEAFVASKIYQQSYEENGLMKAGTRGNALEWEW